ncbi:MAG: GNAT family N-acetyltransferase [Chloroflexota bacterium]
MILRAERVMLRPMREKDAELIVGWRNDPAIRKWLFSGDALTVESHLEWFRRPKPDRLDYVICLRETKRPIGTVSFTRIECQEATAEVGILLGDRTQWGKGLATETYRRWLQFGFRDLELQYIYGRTLSTNHRNIRKNLRLGFCIEEILPDAYRRGEELHDVVIMGLRREDARELGHLQG